MRSFALSGCLLMSFFFSPVGAQHAAPLTPASPPFVRPFHSCPRTVLLFRCRISRQQGGCPMNSTLALDRRAFLRTSAAAGGGLLVALYLPAGKAALASQAPNPHPLAPFAFLKISPDDIVTVISNHSEMGQGIYTALPMLLNEELQADWSKIRVESAPVDAVYNHTVFGMQMTGDCSKTIARLQTPCGLARAPSGFVAFGRLRVVAHLRNGGVAAHQ